jgi:tetratricopeptide (TPR) repeat protein
MMSATGVFAALWCVVLYQKNTYKKRYLFYSVFCFVGALLSKESSLIYPVLLAPFLFYLVRQEKVEEEKERTQPFAPYYPLFSAILVLLLYIVLRSTVLNFATAAAGTVSPFSQRLYETVQSLGIYLKLLFAPFSLHMERTLVHASFWDALAGTVFLCLLLAIVVFALVRKKTRVALGAVWFLLCWLPISGIFPLNAPLAEHWMYVPMAGFWWCLAEILSSLVCSRRIWPIAWAVLFLFCVYLGNLTVQRNLDWSSNERLFLATLRQNPNSARVHYNLAVTYSDLLHNDVAAKRHYEIFLSLRNKERQADPERAGLIIDDEIDARIALGRCLMQLSSFDDALATYLPMVALSEVESLRPTAAMAALRSAQCFLALGEIAQANNYFQQAITLEPLYTAEVEAILGGDAIFNLY